MIQLVEVLPGASCRDPSIEQRISSSPKAKFTRHFIAKQDGDDVGFVAIDTNPNVDYLVVYELFVPARLRGAGLGALLLAEIEKYAVADDYRSVTLAPSPLELGFPPARLVAWYKRLGYTERAECASELEKML